MPDLTKDDVAQYSLVKVDDELATRRKEVERITDGHKGNWSEIPADREGRDRLPKMMEEMNILGVKRDELAALDTNQVQFTAFKEVWDKPQTFLDTATKTKAVRGDFAKQALAKDGLASMIKDGKRGSELAEYDLRAFGFKATLGEDAGSAGVDTEYPLEADRLAGIVDELFQVPNISDLIPVVSTTGDTVQYVTENYTDAAAGVEEAIAIPEATEDFALVTEMVQKIGVAIKSTVEVLGDVGLMRGLLQLRLRQDIGRFEDVQLLNGDGTGQNLTGITQRVGIGDAVFSQAAGISDFMEAIFLAAGTVREAFLNPTTVIMNNGAWEAIRLVREGAGTGQYLFGPPSIAVEPRVWGMRTVLNENMPVHTTNTNLPVLVGDFPGGALIARNPNVAVGVTDADGNDFVADVLTFKASIREALIVHRPPAFATVTVAA